MSPAQIRTDMIEVQIAQRTLEGALAKMTAAQLACTAARARFDFDAAAAPLLVAQKSLSAQYRALIAALGEHGEEVYDREYQRVEAALAT